MRPINKGTYKTDAGAAPVDQRAEKNNKNEGKDATANEIVGAIHSLFIG